MIIPESVGTEFMRTVRVADVGDGLCIYLSTIWDEIIQIDWGGSTAKRAVAAFRDSLPPDVFILSHFHVDHYNGLLMTSLDANYTDRPRQFDIKEVYYPGIPEFRDNVKLLDAFLTINFKVFGNETGLMEFDLLTAIRRINSTRFRHRRVFAGDYIERAGSIFEVLWPPRSFSQGSPPLKVIERALRDFDRACEDRETGLGALYEDIVEQGRSGDYFNSEAKQIEPDFDLDNEHSNRNQEADNRQQTTERRRPSRARTRLHPKVEKANKSLREAANYLSLALFEDNRFLFMGDAEKYQIKPIVNELRKRSRTRFLIFVTPHHGTHWEQSLQNIKCVYALSSNGNRLISKLQPGFREISDIPLVTFVNGDLVVPHNPFFGHTREDFLFLQRLCRLGRSLR
jgi:ribonuclease BN (tRNA processing enzyme)